MKRRRKEEEEEEEEEENLKLVLSFLTPLSFHLPYQISHLSKLLLYLKMRNLIWRSRLRLRVNSLVQGILKKMVLRWIKSISRKYIRTGWRKRRKRRDHCGKDMKRHRGSDREREREREDWGKGEDDIKYWKYTCRHFRDTSRGRSKAKDGERESFIFLNFCPQILPAHRPKPLNAAAAACCWSASDLPELMFGWSPAIP